MVIRVRKLFYIIHNYLSNTECSVIIVVEVELRLISALLAHLCWQQPSGVEGGKAGQQNNTGIPKWRDPASNGANAKKSPTQRRHPLLEALNLIFVI